MLKIECIETISNEEIYKYLKTNPKTLLYTTPRYVSLIANHLNATQKWFLARRDGQLAGVLPCLVRDGALGPVYNSLAFYGSNGGVVQSSADKAAKIAIVNEFYDVANYNGACSATIVNNPLELDGGFYDQAINFDSKDERIGQITHLDAITSPEQLLKIFMDPRPRNIRRALKEGIEIKKSQTLEALDFLFKTHWDNITSIGGIPKEKEFFMKIPENMNSDEWEIFTAYSQNKPIAALLLFYFNETVEYFTPVIVESCRASQPLSLIIYEAMLEAINRGIKNWNWGGTWLNQGGVYDYKKRWGTKDYHYYYYTKLFNKDALYYSKEFLLKNYKGFFVTPFCNLK